MRITFNLPHAFYPGSHPAQNGDVLRALLDCLIDVNVAFLRDHSVPALYRSGVVYGRTVLWDSIPALYTPKTQQEIAEIRAAGFYIPRDIEGLAFGDCKSLTCALIAQYRVSGIAANPVFRWIHREDGSGELDYHILVQTAHKFEDPSKVCGMKEE